MPIYKYKDKEKYIPVDEVAAFEERLSKAKGNPADVFIRYNVPEKGNATVPLTMRDGFLKAYPTAVYIEPDSIIAKQTGLSTPSSDPPVKIYKDNPTIGNPNANANEPEVVSVTGKILDNDVESDTSFQASTSKPIREATEPMSSYSNCLAKWENTNRILERNKAEKDLRKEMGLDNDEGRSIYIKDSGVNVGVLKPEEYAAVNPSRVDLSDRHGYKPYQEPTKEALAEGAERARMQREYQEQVKQQLRETIPALNTIIKENFPYATSSGSLKVTDYAKYDFARNGFEEQLKRGEISQADYDIKMSSLDNEQKDEVIERNSPQTANASAALRLLNDSEKIMKMSDSKDSQNWWQNLTQGVANAHWSNIMSFGSLGAAEWLSISKVMYKFGNDENAQFDQSERLLLAALAQNAAVNDNFETSMAQRIGQSLADNAFYSFMYWGTNSLGAATVGKITKAAVEKAIRKGLGKMVKKAAEKDGLKYFAGRALDTGMRGVASLSGAAAASAAQTLLNPISLTEGTAERMAGDVVVDYTDNGQAVFAGVENQKSLGDALALAFASNTIENISERSGRTLSDAYKFVGKGGKIVAKSALGKHYDTVADILGKASNKIAKTKIGELGNVLGDIANSGRKVYDKVANATGWNGTIEEWYEEQVGTALNALITGESEWKDLLNVGQQIETFLSVAAYGALMRGVSITSDLPNTLPYLGKNSKERRTSTKYVNAARNAITSSDTMGPESLDKLDNILSEGSIEDVADYINKLAVDNKWTNYEVNKVLAYATASIQNSILRQKDTKYVNNEIQKIANQANEISNKDTGEVIYAELRSDENDTDAAPQTITVIEGALIQKEDGTIDNTLSDRTIIIRYPDGKTSMISPRQIGNILYRQPVQNYIEDEQRSIIPTLQSRIERVYDQENDAKPENILDGTAQIGDNVTLKSEKDGDIIDGIITEHTEDGEYIVELLDEKGEIYATKTYTQEELAAALYIEDIQQKTEELKEIESEDEIAKPMLQQLSDVAINRIPRDNSGGLFFEEANPEDTVTVLLNSNNNSIEDARNDVSETISALESALSQAKSQAIVPDDPTNMNSRMAAKKAHRDAVEAIQRKLAYWNGILAMLDETVSSRKREAAVLRKTEEEKSRAEREEAERIEREALNGVPDMVDDTPHDARARGYRRVSGHKINRQEPLQALQGKGVSVRFSDDVIANGRVAVIDATQLQPSHIQGVRNPFHFIDEAQPKERNDEASVMSARKIAGNIRPEEITSSTTAYTGAPTVNARGEVIQGNNRSDALRLIWESHKDKAEQYKQYLKDHAEEFGLRAEDIDAMKRPVLVNMLDVEDVEAINLGQFVAQDTESGGAERIKPKNAMQKMGNDMRTFSNLLLASSDDETSFAGLIDRNGAEVLKWMSQKRYITPTQYKSAFDSKGNLTAEAKNDLRGIMYHSIFKDGSTRLEEMFNALPAKAQKAILATAFRDYDSPIEERMIEEIQSSIRAYYALSQSDDFAEAKTYEDARLAVEGWKIQYQMDDVTGDSYLPAENFSNFALLLATMYKGERQLFIQSTFNKLYDLIQGVQEADLFEQPDNTPRTLAQAIKEVLNIDYNGHVRSNVLAGDNTTSQRGPRKRNGDAASGEQIKNGGRTADRAGGIESNSLSRGSETRVQETHEEVEGLSETEIVELMSRMEANASPIPKIELNPTNWRRQFGDDGMVRTPQGMVKMGANQIEKLFEKGRSEQFGMIKPTLETPQIIVEVPSEATDGNSERDSSLLFVKTFLGKNGEKVYYFKSVTVKKDGLEVSISSHYDRPKRVKEALKKGKLLYRFDGGAQTEHHPADVSVTASPEDVQGNKKEVWSASEAQNEQSATDSTLRDEDKSDNPTTPNGNVPSTSDIKDTKNSPNANELGEKVATESNELQVAVGRKRNEIIGRIGYTEEERKRIHSEFEAELSKLRTMEETENGYDEQLSKVRSLQNLLNNWNDLRNDAVEKELQKTAEYKAYRKYVDNWGRIPGASDTDVESIVAAYKWGLDGQYAFVGNEPTIIRQAYYTGQQDKEKGIDRTEQVRQMVLQRQEQQTDAQGNPIDNKGKLVTERISSIDELGDEDFTNPTRSVELPELPQNVQDAIGTEGKPVVIKKNIFEKNRKAHVFTPQESRNILGRALYNTDIVGQSQPNTRKNRWIAIKLDDKSPIVVIEVSNNKDNVDVVGWYTLDNRNLDRIRRQAEREGGEFLILTSKEAAASLSTLPFGKSPKGKDNKKNATYKQSAAAPAEKIEDVGEKIAGARKDREDNIRYNKTNDNNTLVAVHNLSEKKLKDALELGGFPIPSIAVINSDTGHSEFGEISLLFGKESIDPSDRRNKVYGGDAWTPTFPSVDYKLNDNKTSDIYRRANKVGSLPLYRPVAFHPDNYKGNIEGFGTESLVDHFKDDYDAKQFYLSETGNPVEQFEKVEVNKYSDDAVSLYDKVLVEIGLERLKNDSYESLENDMKRIISQHDGVDFVNIKPHRIKIKIDNTRRNAIDYAENGNKEIRNDIEATQKKIDERIDQKEFEKWLDELFAGVVEKKGIRNTRDWYTPSGRSRKWEELYDEITLDNVVKAMQTQAMRGGEGLFGGNIFGAAQEEYKSIKDIRTAAKRRIRKMSYDEYKIQQKAITERLSAINIRGVGNSFSDIMDMAENIKDAVARSHTPKGIYKYLKEFYPNVTMENANEIASIVKDIQNMSTRYFEAKPYRAVGFDEVGLAVVPSDMDANLVNELKSRGIQVREYEKGNEEQRRRIVNEATEELNLRFQRGESVNALTAEEVALRDAITDRLRQAGIEVIDDTDAGQKILDEVNGKGVMLSAKKKIALETASVQKEHQPTVVSSVDGAKILKNIDDTISEYGEKSNYHKTFLGDAAKALGAKFFRTPQGEAYGFTVGGRIYIDPRIANVETPIHEYVHLWASALRESNPQEWQNIVGLMRDTPVWEEVKLRYPELKSDDEIADEVLATYSGRRGAEKLRKEQKKIADGNGSIFDKASGISAIERVREALSRFWKEVADFLHIHYTSAEEVADRVLGDLLEGVNPNEASRTAKLKQRQLDVVNATNPMLDDYHTGIRKEGDIRTLREAISEAREEAEKYGDEAWSAYPDITNELLEEALQSGRITVYSSKPIKNGNFVTPSKMQANGYAGGGKIYSKTVDIDDVAWIDTDEGQYASAGNDLSLPDNRLRFQYVGDGSVPWFSAEEDDIINRAKSDGTWMKAPNGEPTNLTERQWVQVRTKAFKEWFGDWEKAARIEKLRNAPSVIISGNEIKMSDDIVQYRKNSENYAKGLRGTYINADTGNIVNLTRSGITGLKQHDVTSIPHLQSFAAIPMLIEQSIYISTLPNEDEKVKADSFDYYVAGLRIGEDDYTAKIVLANIDGKRYYDHKLTSIEKGSLLDLIRISNLNQEQQTAISDIKDKRLVSILQTNSSKVVDENGEPLVVYHGTATGGFTVFNNILGDSEADINYDDRYFFSTSKIVADGYSTKRHWKYDGTHSDDGHIDMSVNDNDLEIFEREDHIGRKVFRDYGVKYHGEQIPNSYAETPEEAIRNAKKSIASNYKTPNSIVYECFINLKNPFVKDAEGRLFINVFRLTNGFPSLEELIELGHDGIIVKNIDDSAIPVRTEIATDVIALYPTQIKSATDNIGSFDLNNDDIRYRTSANPIMAGAATDSIKDKRAFIDDFNKQTGLNIHVVTSENVAKKDAAGFTDGDGNITIVVDNNSNIAEIQATIIHELVGHNAMYDTICKLVANKHGVDRATLYADILELLPDALRSRAIYKYEHGDYSDLGIAVDEVLAEEVEKSEFIKPNIWKRICARVRGFLRKVWPTLNIKISDNDIKYMFWRSWNASVKKTGVTDENMRMLLGIGGKFENSAQQIYDEATSNLWFKFKQEVVDGLAAVEELQKAISEVTGSPIQDFANVVNVEAMRISRTKAMEDYMNKKFMDPLVSYVGSLLKNGVTYDDILNYLYAKHGLERNEEFRKRKAEKLNSDILNYIKKAIDDGRDSKTIIDGISENYKRFKDIINGSLLESTIKEVRALKNKSQDIPQDYAIEFIFSPDLELEDNSGLTALAKKLDPNNKNYTEVAENIVGSFENHIGEEAVADLWEKINNLSDAILHFDMEHGRLSNEQYANINSMYKYYVPLRGWGEDDSSSVYDYYTTPAKIQQSVKKAKGRTSLADDPIATLNQMLHSSVILGLKNRSTQALFRLALNYKTDVLTISDIWYEKVQTKDGKYHWKSVAPDIPTNATREEAEEIIDAFNSSMKEKAAQGIAKRNRQGIDVGVPVLPYNVKEHQVSTWFNGQEYIINVNGNPKVAQLFNPKSDKRLFEIIAKGTRFMAALNTSYSPAFVVTNGLRDVTAAVSLAYLKEGGEYAQQFISNLPSAYQTAARYINGNYKDDPNIVYFEEFVRNGGETGFTRTMDIQGWKNDTQRDVRKAAGQLTKAEQVGYFFSETLAGNIENLNRIVEDAPRFAAYITSRQMGKSIAQSSRDAKEITVNFNRHGAANSSIMQFIRAGYAFTNAAIQGMYNITSAMWHNKTRAAKLATTITLMGILNPLWNMVLIAILGDDDDWMTYRFLNTFRATNRFVLFNPFGGGFITIPVSQELVPLYGSGVLFSRYMLGLDKNTNPFSEAINLVFDLSPIKFAEDGEISWRGLVPTAVQPFYDVINNTNWFGGTLYKEYDYGGVNTNKEDPEYTKAFAGRTPKAYVELSKFINRATGGDEVQKGWGDTKMTNPAVMQHLAEQYTGGIGRTIGQFINLVEGIYYSLDNNSETEVDNYLDAKNWPIMSSLFMSSNMDNLNGKINSIYYQYDKVIKQTERDLKKYYDEINNAIGGDNYDVIYRLAERAAEIKNSPDYSMVELFKTLDKVLKKVDDPELVRNTKLNAILYLENMRISADNNFITKALDEFRVSINNRMQSKKSE